MQNKSRWNNVWVKIQLFFHISEKSGKGNNQKSKKIRRQGFLGSWSRRQKIGVVVLMVALIVLLAGCISYVAIFRPVRVVEKVVMQPPITKTVTVNVTDPALVAENAALSANNTVLVAENNALKAKNTDLMAENDLLKAKKAELDILKTWSSFGGDEAMKLALSTFGNIRIKVFFDQGEVPLLSEVTQLLTQKPPDLTLSFWVGSIERAKDWPVGMASPNAGEDWGTEVFLAKDADGTVKYYYIAPRSGNILPVDRSWVTNNNIYWLFIDTPRLRG